MMKGMVELPAVAVFTIAAGSLIVLFFVVVAQNQADNGRRDIEIASLERFESLLKNAATARETENNITVIDETLLFVCDEVSTRIEYESRIGKDFQGLTVFAPHRLTGGKLRLYSRGIDVPYRMGNILYMTTDAYSVTFAGNNQAVIDMYKKDAPQTFVSDAGKRTVAFVTNSPQPGSSIRENTVVVYQEPGQPYGAVYYPNHGVAYYMNPETLYGAILSDDAKTYSCTMESYLKKLRFNNNVQYERTKLLYADASPQCKQYYQLFPFETIEEKTKDGTLDAGDAQALTQAQAQLAFMNENILRGDNCVTIY